GGPHAQRSRQDRHAGYLAAGRVHAVLFDLCGHQGAGRTLHPRGSQGIRRTRHFGERGRPRPDGYAVLLRPGKRRCAGLSQERGRAFAVHRYRPHRHPRH
ncbi:hypothetical protein LTR94_036667, partial [Friedmanniomyces endolithicus]